MCSDNLYLAGRPHPGMSSSPSEPRFIVRVMVFWLTPRILLIVDEVTSASYSFTIALRRSRREGNLSISSDIPDRNCCDTPVMIAMKFFLLPPGASAMISRFPATPIRPNDSRLPALTGLSGIALVIPVPRADLKWYHRL